MPLRGRLALWYFLLIGSIGALNPWLAVVLEGAGASGLMLAGILSLFPLGVLFAGPLGSWLADRTGREVVVLRVSVLLAAVASVALAGANGLLALSLATLGVALFRAPPTAVADMYTVRQVGWDRMGYGRIRAVGSIGFILAVFGVGAMLDVMPRSPLWISAAAMVALAGLTFALPRRERSEAERANTKTAPWPLLRNPVLVSLFVVAILHRSTISFYDAFFALHATGELGLPSWVPGTSIALGVAMEVLVLVNGHRLLARFGPFPLVLVAVLASAPRWLLTGMLTDPVGLIAVQALHGLSFGAWWVGGLAIVSRHTPEALRNTGQGLFLASGHGVGTLVSMGLAAVLLDRTTTGVAFFWMAGLSAAALVAVLVALLPALRTARRASG
jgi:MFS transporter, PPP family, 3-phenylpropionic acid transporter